MRLHAVGFGRRRKCSLTTASESTWAGKSVGSKGKCTVIGTSRSARLGLFSRAAAGALAVAAGFAVPAMAADPPIASEGEEEITVTATRREEALRKVPIAVTAISAKTVKEDRIFNFADLPAAVPGATFISTKGQSTANIQIRGQASTNDSPHVGLPVAVFMDDIYYGSLASFAADFFDIAQIAVLRGPQGTTFGRNVVGGGLQIISNKPEIGVTGGEITVGLSMYDTARDPGFDAQGYYNVAGGETWAARLAYSVKDIGGFSHNRVTDSYLSDQKSFALRPSVRWQPTPEVDVMLMGFYYNEHGAPSGYRAVGQGSIVAAMRAAEDNPWDVFHDEDGKALREIWMTQLRADWDTGNLGTLTSITSYRALDTEYFDDGDSGPLALNKPSLNASEEWQFSQELRLASPSGQTVEYIVGAYYSHESLFKLISLNFQGDNPNSFLSVLTRGQVQNQNVFGDSIVDSFAVFGEAKWHITDELSLTAGARYTVEDKGGYTTHLGTSAFYGAGFHVELDDSWNSFDPRVILDWKPNDDMLFYASYSTGFKSGGWSLTSTSAAAAVIPLEPEESKSYEIGTKLNFFESALQVNLALYQADTRNLQVRSLVNGVLTDSNAGEARVRGLELEAVAQPFDGFTLGVNYAYTDAEYSSFVGCAAGGVDCTGNKLPFVPENDVRIFAEYEWEMNGGALMTAKVDAQWASDYELLPTNGPSFMREFTSKDGVVNTSLIYETADSDWKVQVWAKNLTNEWSASTGANYFFYFLTPAEFAAGNRIVERSSISPPRQIGISITKAFN
jgi:iron complex outermembrane receptor protein